jgi:DNA-binding CsgD family transcriptional regulator
MGQDSTTTASQAPNGAPHRRVLLIARPCLIASHLREALSLSGIHVQARPFDRPVLVRYDACVVFHSRCDPGVLAVVRQRVMELQSRNPGVPTIALIEDRDTEAVDFAQFSTVIFGLPSIAFAVEVIQLALTMSRAAPEPEPELEPELLQDDVIRVMAPAVCFTKREADLLELLRQGLPNKLIAHRLGVTTSTVKTHLFNIFRKAKVSNRTELACMLSTLPLGPNPPPAQIAQKFS